MSMFNKSSTYIGCVKQNLVSLGVLCMSAHCVYTK